MNQNSPKATQSNPVNVLADTATTKPLQASLASATAPAASAVATATPTLVKAEAKPAPAPAKAEIKAADKPAAKTAPAKTQKAAKKAVKKDAKKAKKQTRELERNTEQTVYQMTDHMAEGGRKSIEKLASSSKALANANQQLHMESRREMDKMFADNVELAKDLLTCRTFANFIDVQNRAVQKNLSHAINQGAQLTSWWFSLSGQDASASTSVKAEKNAKTVSKKKPASKVKGKRSPGRPKKRTA